MLLAFLSLVNGWADRSGRRGDQRVKRTKLLQFNRAANGETFLNLNVQPEEGRPRPLYDLTAIDKSYAFASKPHSG